jgi:hypothetical protein
MINAGWFRNNMPETVVETIYYNKNSKIGVLLYLRRFIDNSGAFKTTLKSLIFLPQNYAE